MDCASRLPTNIKSCWVGCFFFFRWIQNAKLCTLRDYLRVAGVRIATSSEFLRHYGIVHQELASPWYRWIWIQHLPPALSLSETVRRHLALPLQPFFFLNVSFHENSRIRNWWSRYESSRQMCWIGEKKFFFLSQPGWLMDEQWNWNGSLPRDTSCALCSQHFISQ